MMANRPLLRRLDLALAGLVLAALTSCSMPQVVPPAPAPVPVPAPAPPPAASPPASLPPVAPPRSTEDWTKAALTPGDWTWRMEGGRSVARFGGDLLVLTCDRAAKQVALVRKGPVAAQPAVTVSTSDLVRTMIAATTGDASPAMRLVLPASDRLLDAMAFSRGRFALETSGQPRLIVPSWPEIGRVVEDCR